MAEQPLSHRRVLRIALPIVLSNVTVPLLGAVDTGVVGQLGLAAPIGAVGLGAVVLASIYWIFGFLRMGTSGLAAQARGEGNRAEEAAILIRALLIGALVGLGMVALQQPLIRLALSISPGSAEVEGLARAYLRLRIWGAPATICLYAITGWLIAQERTRGVLGLQVLMNGLNVGLDLWFVLGLGWGVPGVAVATLIAEWSGLGFGLWLCREGLGGGRGQVAIDWQRVADWASLRRMLAVNADILLRTVVLQGSFTAFVFLGAGFGDVTLAANQVLMQFLEITAFGLDGFAFAAESLVGQAVGAGSALRVRRAAWVTSQWGGGGAVLLAAGFWLAGPWLIDLIAASGAVRAEARTFLPWVVLAPVIGIASWMFDGIFIGATRTKEMRNAMAVSVAIYGVALWLMVPGFGNHGLWAALMVLNLARGASMALYYRRVEQAAGGFADFR